MGNIQEILQRTFGYANFRPPQQEIIQTVVNGGDALVLMPTGGGKSLCRMRTFVANDKVKRPSAR